MPCKSFEVLESITDMVDNEFPDDIIYLDFKKEFNPLDAKLFFAKFL